MLTMDKLINVILTIDKVHSTPQRALDSGPGLGIRSFIYLVFFRISVDHRHNKLKGFIFVLTLLYKMPCNKNIVSYLFLVSLSWVHLLKNITHH